MQTVLLILGIVAVIAGVFALFRRRWLWGAILVIIGMALGGFGFFG